MKYAILFTLFFSVTGFAQDYEAIRYTEMGASDEIDYAASDYSPNPEVPKQQVSRVKIRDILDNLKIFSTVSVRIPSGSEFYFQSHYQHTGLISKQNISAASTFCRLSFKSSDNKAFVITPGKGIFLRPHSDSIKGTYVWTGQLFSRVAVTLKCQKGLSEKELTLASVKKTFGNDLIVKIMPSNKRDY